MRRCDAGVDEMDLSRWARQERDDDERESFMKSIGAQIKTLQALVSTQSVNLETGVFIVEMHDITDNGRSTTVLTSEQVDRIHDLHTRYFGPVT